jgi:toxin secretion/phage lysis holin
MENLKALSEVAFSNDLWILLLPAACMAIDIITGVLNAWIHDDVKSPILRKGLAKKGGELMAIILGEALTIGMNVPKQILVGISAYIIFMEVVSIFENLGKLGVPIPGPVKKALSTFSETFNGKTEDDESLSEDTRKNLKNQIQTKKGGGKNGKK